MEMNGHGADNDDDNDIFYDNGDDDDDDSATLTMSFSLYSECFFEN